MTRYLLSTAVFLLLAGFVSAQPRQSSKHVSFESIVKAGILEGQSDKTAAQFQLVNGVRFNTWFTGIGAGIDYYGHKRSIPLFLNIQRDLRSGVKTPFAYADAGYNFSWLRNSEKQSTWNATQSTSGGMYYEIGLGYKFLFKNKIYMGLSAGYSYKQQSEKIVSHLNCDFCLPPEPQTQPDPVQELTYEFRRISFKLNCWF